MFIALAPLNKISKIQSVNSSNQSIFWNFALDKGRLKSFISWFLKNHGEKKTLELVEQLKDLGFGYATKAGVSLGIEDLKIPPKKIPLLAKAEFKIAKASIAYRKGQLTGIEKMQTFIETWHETSETLKDEVVRYFEKTDVLNPVYMMAFSGARGNLSQVRQLVGMRGLMSDPQGKIIDFPIQSNFREGLTLTEYLISTYGARKGIVDTALRTATAGYLTRRLVDVAQHVIVSKFDCGTNRGIFLFDMKEGIKTIYSFENRLIGRVLAQDIYTLNSNLKIDQRNPSANFEKISSRNQEITPELAFSISKVTKKALVRSPLTCETRKLVCQLCYGWSLATSRLVSIGEAVGVIAGQSIGEPGTQLTMRTFHTGGVFSGSITQQIHASFNGIVEYGEPISGSCIRTPQGDLAFFTKSPGTMIVKAYDPNSESQDSLSKTEDPNTASLANIYKLPPFTILFARHGQLMQKEQLLAQISAFSMGQKSPQIVEQTIYSSLEGEVYYNQIDLLEDIDEKYGERISKAEDWAKVWVLSAKIFKQPLNSDFFPICGDFIDRQAIFHEIQWIPNLPQFFSLDPTLIPSLKSPNFEYAYPIKPEKIQKSVFTKDFFPKQESKKKIYETAIRFVSQKKQSSSTLKSNFKIVPKYNVKQKFFLTAYPSQLNFSQQTSLLNPAFLNIQQFLSVKNSQKLKTKFLYPYQKNLRRSFLKGFSQISISIPRMRPGFLKNFVKTISLDKTKKRPFSRTRNEKVLGLRSRRSIDLRPKTSAPPARIQKLNLNKKFLSYNFEKPDFFHLLILENFIPMVLTLKTFKSLLTKKPLGFKVQSKSSDSSRNFSENIHSVISDNFVEKRVFSPSKKKTLRFRKKDFFGRIFTKKTLEGPNFSQKKTFNIQPWNVSKFQAKKLEMSLFKKFSKSEQLSIKTPLLSFTPQNIRYQKLGYFISYVRESNEFDQFFSFLPLKPKSILDLNQRNGVQQSSESKLFPEPFASSLSERRIFGLRKLRSQEAVHESFAFVSSEPTHAQKSKIFTEPNFIDLQVLQNTDDWSPMTRAGFSWFPNFSQLQSTGILFFLSPTLSQKKIQRKSFRSKTKNFKTLFLETKNSLEFLNIAQSQRFQKSTKILRQSHKKLKPNEISLGREGNEGLAYLTKPFSKYQKNLSLLNFQNIGKKNILNIEKPRIFQQLGFAKNTLLTPNLNHHFLKRNPFFLLKKEKDSVKNEWKNLEKTSPKTFKQIQNLTTIFIRHHFSSSVQTFRKNPLKVSRYNEETAENNSLRKQGFLKNTKKLGILFKKNHLLLKNLDNLVYKLNFTQKLSVSFHEVYWLAQENYLVNLYLSTNEKKNLSEEKFFCNHEKNSFSYLMNQDTFWRVNNQGLKKSLTFKTEGVLKIQPIKTFRFRKKSSKQLTKKESNLFEKTPFFKKRKRIFSTQQTFFEHAQKNVQSSSHFQRNSSFSCFKTPFKLPFEKAKFSQRKASSASEPGSKGHQKQSLRTRLGSSVQKEKAFVHGPRNFSSNFSRSRSFEESLRSKFLNYLKTQNYFIKKVSGAETLLPAMTNELEFFSKSPNQSFFIGNVTSGPGFRRGWSPEAGESHFFSSFPFRKNKIERSRFQPVLQKNEQKIPKLEKNRFTVSLKAGWIYKTLNPFPVFQTSEISFSIQTAQPDDICFNPQKVVVEKIFLEKNFQSERNIWKKSFFVEKKNFSQTKNQKLFQINFVVKNSTSRWLISEKTLNPEMNCECGPNSKNFEIQRAFFFLIRPLNHKILPNVQGMKIQLYKSISNRTLIFSKPSYLAYKNYFSNELNLQKTYLKTFSNFAPFDIQVTPAQTWPLINAFQKEKNFTRKCLSGKIQSKKSQNEILMVSKVNENKFRKVVKESYFQQRFFKTSQKKKCKSSSVQPMTLNRFLPIYFSNNTLNVFPLNVTLKLSQTPVSFYSFPQISLTTRQKSLLGQRAGYKNVSNSCLTDQSVNPSCVMNWKFKLEEFVKMEYFNILLHRNLKEKEVSPEKRDSLNEKNFFSRTEKAEFPKTEYKESRFKNVESSRSFIQYLVKPVNKILELDENIRKTSTNLFQLNRLQKILPFQDFRGIFDFLPVFEYSLNQNYSFFANQRLFASSFYQRQFETLVKFGVFSGHQFDEESFRDKRFTEKSSMQTTYSSSFHDKPISKNKVILKNQNFEKSFPFGLTSFYSPFEGEILKLYSEEFDLLTLKKGVNVNLENSFLKDRQFQKLILTKADLFSLQFAETQRNGLQSTQFKESEKDFSQKKLNLLFQFHQTFQNLEKKYSNEFSRKNYPVLDFTTTYQNKRYKLKRFEFAFPDQTKKLRLGQFLRPGEKLYSNCTFLKSGQIIHINSKKLTLRKAEFFTLSPQAILHTYNGHCLTKNAPVMTLPFQTLKTGDIVQGIPKVEQYLEARTTIQGRLFLNSLPVLLYAIFQRYSMQLNSDKAVRQSFLKIQQILVDGVQRVYRSQGVSIADKHLEIIVRQMTSKVKIIHGGQTGFFAGELVDLEFVERINKFLMVKIRYEPIVLGITRASLEVDSFLSAASFQQTTKILTRSAIENKRDFLKGLKENLLVGNLLPAGTGFIQFSF